MNLEITCPPSPKLQNGTANTSLALYGTVVGYTCLYGYQFLDEMTTQHIQCTEDGNWTKEPADCSGQFHQ